MAHPLIPIAVVAGIALAGAAGFVVHKEWAKRARTLAFIGRSEAGKTTMAAYLAKGNLPSSTHSTVDTKTHRVRPNVFRVDQATVRVVDSGGNETSLSDWKRAVESSDDVFYFFDARKVYDEDPDTLSALSADADHLRNWRKKSAKATVHLVGTHTDQLPSDAAARSRVRSHSVVKNLRSSGEVKDGNILFGSLNSVRDARKLVNALNDVLAGGA